MTKVNPIAVLVAAIAAFVASGFYYGGLFGDAWMELAGIDPAAGMSPMQIIAQFVRELIVAAALAGLIVAARVADWRGAVRLALLVWFGFQAMAIAGSVIHEAYPWQLYLIHTGDALMKTVLVSVLVTVWRKRRAAIEQGA